MSPRDHSTQQRLRAAGSLLEKHFQRHSPGASGTGFGDVLPSRLYSIAAGKDWESELSPPHQ